MAGFEDLADEAEARDEEMPGTRSPANDLIGGEGTDPLEPTSDTEATSGAWAAADHTGSDEGDDGFGPEGTRSPATEPQG